MNEKKKEMAYITSMSIGKKGYCTWKCACGHYQTTQTSFVCVAWIVSMISDFRGGVW
jgi:hypothetical protein